MRKIQILEKVSRHQIPIQTLQFLTALPTRQDEAENRDMAIFRVKNYIQVVRNEKIN